MSMEVQVLRNMGLRCVAMRYYWWFKHFLEVGPLDNAAYFLALLRNRDKQLPEPWEALKDEYHARLFPFKHRRYDVNEQTR